MVRSKSAAIVIGVTLMIIVMLVVYAASGTGAPKPAFKDAAIGPFPIPSYMQDIASLHPRTQPAATGTSVLTHKARDTEDALRQGWKLVNERSPESAIKAIAIFEEAIRDVDSGNADFYGGLGRACLIGGRSPEAIKAFQTGLTLAPGNSELHSGIGWGYWNLKKYGNAREAWEYALSINRRSKDAWSAMAWIYLATKDRDRALLGFTTLLELEPDNKAWGKGLTFARGSIYTPEEIRIFFPLPDVPDMQAAFAVPARAAATGPGVR